MEMFLRVCCKCNKKYGCKVGKISYNCYNSEGEKTCTDVCPTNCPVTYGICPDCQNKQDKKETGRS